MEAFEVGEVVIIERKGRPWRQDTIATIKDELLMTERGHWYEVATRARIDSGDDRPKDFLVKCTPERLAYLEVRAFLKAAPTLNVEKLSLSTSVELARLAKIFLEKLT
ncbi:hypothetical protein [Deinococcus yavapaiensis]|uniref:Uncharacterized protein n=1 Tax=Deinococcus yavapaiensis KR-236 TaxID=694435 RepID=A0A318S6Y0_9DEIO|nr:hypothetical protein [Deinococcus yavapaiensis]PYE50940.1 hypothetical protein DES52_1166 [Deinococcus yavapaiensis KR-236]